MEQQTRVVVALVTEVPDCCNLVGSLACPRFVRFAGGEDVKSM